MAEESRSPGPLAGRTVLITRAQSQQSKLATAIRALGGKVWDFPTIAIAEPEDWSPVDAALRRLGEFRWLVFTSQNGVERFLARMRAVLGQGPEALRGLWLVAVGRATADALAAHGLETAVMPARFRGSEVAAAMAPQLAPGDPVLLALAAEPAADIAGDLRRLGARPTQVTVYRTVPTGSDPAPLRAALAAGTIDYATFTSPSTVRSLDKALGSDAAALLQGVTVACIGPTTAAAARALGLQVAVVPEEYTVPALAAAVAAHAAGVGGTGGVG